MSQGRYLHTGQHEHKTNAYTRIHALSGIGTHDPSVLASDDSSCLRPRGHCDRLMSIYSLYFESVLQPGDLLDTGLKECVLKGMQSLEGFRY
jgi:hypothetical protein